MNILIDEKGHLFLDGHDVSNAAVGYKLIRSSNGERLFHLTLVASDIEIRKNEGLTHGH